MNQEFVTQHSLFDEKDIYLFRSGKHTHLFDKMGSHPFTLEKVAGTYFAVYAPAASDVEVIGDFNEWIGEGYSLFVRWDGSGIWEGFIPSVKIGDKYKYQIHSKVDSRVRVKTDPYAQHNESPPSTAAVVWKTDYIWGDANWIKNRVKFNGLDRPYAVYEVHLGSWRRDEEGNSLSYQQHADLLVKYVQDMGYTHVEMLPVMEHPYEPSWGYQVTGFFTPSSRFGSPEEFKALVDEFHNAGIGVILDWVPAHFPKDDWALADFDGSKVYEHPDPRKGYHQDWDTYIFNFGRNEVRSFLLSSAVFWMKQYHIDGLRVDAVASMIYLDYSRKEGEWEPNMYGGNENLDAISFIKDFNEAVYRDSGDGVHTIAEESTAFAGVTRPSYNGGLGFGMKWMMGWMHDTLDYFKKDPIYRKFHQNNITFSLVYAFTENFMLPLSHDEVVHGKGSMITKMPGDEWNRFANLRALYAYMYTHPGSKLLFMGGDIAQYSEWNDKTQLDWHLLQFEPHKGINTLVRDLNHLYKSERALFELQYDVKGFEWVDFSDHSNSIISYLRKCDDIDESILTICNLTANPHLKYKIGVPQRGEWQVIFNSDDKKYWGSGFETSTRVKTKKDSHNGRMFSIELNLPPLSVMVLKLY